MSQASVDLRLVGFRYAPAIGGAEQLARRLLQALAERVSADVVTLATDNRSDWLRLLTDGERSDAETYEIDGRRVTALGAWHAATRRQLRLLAPLYHLPRSPAPTLMGRRLAPEIAPLAIGARLIHNVFMGREAFSLGWLLAAQRAGIPFVFTPLRHQRPLGWSSPAFRQLYARSNAVIALTDAESSWLQQRGAPPERTHVIGLGPSNDPEASPEAARRLLGDRKIVLFLGQLHAYKGFRVLLAAARSLARRDDTVFVFAGPDVRNHARAFARAPQNARYLAQVDQPLRDSLLQAATVLCVPSSRESFGAVLVEAWACGKPVIGGPAAATRSVIDDGVDGFIVPQDVRSLVPVLERLLDDDELCRRLGQAGRRKVEARYSWASIAQRHLAIYEALAERAHRSP